MTRRLAPAGPDWIPAAEATALLGVSPATLRRWADAGHLAVFTTPGGHRRFDRSAIQSLLRSGPDEVGPSAAERRAGLRSREEGVVAALRDYLRAPAAGRPAALRTARSRVADYGAATRAAGLSAARTVTAFQDLRSRALRELTTSGADLPGSVPADRLLDAVEQCDCLLETCIGSHESGRRSAP